MTTDAAISNPIGRRLSRSRLHYALLMTCLLAVGGIVLVFVNAAVQTAQTRERLASQADEVARTGGLLMRNELNHVYLASTPLRTGFARKDVPAHRWITGVGYAQGDRVELDGEWSATRDDVIAKLRRPELGELRDKPEGTSIVRRLVKGASIAAISAGADEDSGRLFLEHIDHERVIETVYQPLVALVPGLELVGGPGSGGWSAPLPHGLHEWRVGVSAQFVRGVQRRVFVQSLLPMALVIVALVLVLLTMRAAEKVVARDLALAEMKGAFVADVSHELKTPLALIRMFSEMLSSGRVEDEAKRAEYYAIIVRESDRLTRLIDNILDFARSEEGLKSPARTEVNMRSLIQETYSSYAPELDQRGFTHRLTWDDPLPLIQADRLGLTQVLVNLLSNAIKYAGDDKYLHIHIGTDIRRDFHGLLITVEDHGIGIRPEDVPHLFDGFYRSADRRVREQRGTGLGLALCKRIIDAHGGSLEVEPRLVKGTVFRVFLPAGPATRVGSAG